MQAPLLSLLSNAKCSHSPLSRRALSCPRRSFTEAPLPESSAGAGEAGDPPRSEHESPGDEPPHRPPPRRQRSSVTSVGTSGRSRPRSRSGSARSRRQSFVIRDPEYPQEPVTPVAPRKRDYWKRVREVHRWRNSMTEVMARAPADPAKRASQLL